MAPQGEKIAALDGLRGLSISLVLLAHLSGTRDLATRARLYDLDSRGNLGVRVFFVISGLLITLLLLRERATTARARKRIGGGISGLGGPYAPTWAPARAPVDLVGAKHWLGRGRSSLKLTNLSQNSQPPASWPRAQNDWLGPSQTSAECAGGRDDRA